MINRTVLVGRLTKDPELRKSGSGNSFISFTVAVDNRVRPGEAKSASFINCVAFGNSADNMAKYTRKGSLVGVEGRLQQRNYATKDGTQRCSLVLLCDSIQFLDSRQSGTNQDYTPTLEPQTNNDNKNLDAIDIVDDDLPF